MNQAILRVVIGLSVMLAAYAHVPDPQPKMQFDHISSTSTPNTYSLVIQQYKAISVVEHSLTLGVCYEAMQNLPFSACEIEQPI